MVLLLLPVGRRACCSLGLSAMRSRRCACTVGSGAAVAATDASHTLMLSRRHCTSCKAAPAAAPGLPAGAPVELLLLLLLLLLLVVVVVMPVLRHASTTRRSSWCTRHCRRCASAAGHLVAPLLLPHPVQSLGAVAAAMSS
jgi:hypothetical protein